MRRFFHPLFLSLALIGVVEFLPGCDSESKNPDVKVAEEAVGVSSDTSGNRETVEKTRDLTVVKDTKVIDNKTGKVINEKQESTPVQIKQETSERTKVRVDVGDTETKEAGANAAPK